MVKTKKVVKIKKENVKYVFKTVEYAEKRRTANEIEHESNIDFNINEAKQALASLSEYLETLQF